MISNRDKLKIAIVASLILAGVVVLFLFPYFPASYFAYDVHRGTMYIPVILAGFWFGLRGGLVTALVIIFVYLPFVMGGLGALPNEPYSDRIIEMIVFLAIAGVTGYLAERLRAERNRAAQACEELEQAHTDLGSKITDLFDAEEQLRRGERFRILGELSSELAHEIQNPLASITGTAEIINDSCRRQCGTGEFLDILMSEIKRLRNVLDRFLDFARNQDTETSVCDALKTFESVIKLMRPQMDKRRIRLSQQAPEDGCYVRISDEQLKQVFLNLVLNAIQAMPQGGEIFADFEKRRDEAVIAIRDTGPGVKEKDTEKIFDPFFSTKRGGTGLGLPIVWRIVAKHNGTITLAPRSEAARGACFVITLPQCSDAEKIALRA